MSGHNKWSKVKRIKGPLDAKRGKLFTKLIKEITVAARLGGGNIDGNPRLRAAIQAGKDASMPRENIERAVLKGTGELEGETYEEVLYEGYGPGGVAIIVEATSDNRNRTVNDLRLLFRKLEGHLGEVGSVAWMFDHVGHLVFERGKYSEDDVTTVALDAGAQDVTAAGGSVEVVTGVGDVYKVKEAFDRVGFHPTEVGFAYLPKAKVPIADKATAEKVLDLLHEIEEHEDVQRVHANIDMHDKMFTELSAS